MLTQGGNNADSISLWKKLSGYHTRSLAETAFSRFKRLFGDRLFSKTRVNMEAEIMFKCHVLNRMRII